MVHVDVDKVREVIKGTGDSELEHQHHAEQASVHFELQESVVQAEKSLDLARRGKGEKSKKLTISSNKLDDLVETSNAGEIVR
ncbi:hypothetical protein V6N11_057002 [Hibiscus sabdariffa]|uniref:Uncharacterized protein n=1 Tax=Hibiscus sabdariffa TaxID=183260 RepID=A0ABR2T5G2_9ROSI